MKRKGVFFQWFSSYCLVLLLPFLLSIVIYSYSGNTIRNKYITNNQMLQRQMNSLFAQNISSVEALKNQLLGDSMITSYMNSSGNNASKRFNLVKIRDYFKTLHVVNPCIDCFYVYFNNSDKYLNSISFYDAGTMYHHVHADCDMDITIWSQIHDEWQDNAIYYLHKKDGSTQILIANTLPHYRIYYNRATLYMVTKPERLFGSLDELPFDGMTYYAVLNENNEVLLSNAGFDYKKLEAECLNNGKKDFEQIIDGKKYFVSCLPFSNFGWKSVILLSDEAIGQSARGIRNFTFLAAFFCMLFDIFFAHRLTKKHYMPLKNIMNTVMSEDWQGGNEYAEIQHQFDFLLQNRKELKITLDKYQKRLRNEFLTSLLKGKINDRLPDSETLKNDYGISCSGEKMYLALVCTNEPLVIENTALHAYGIALDGMQAYLFYVDINTNAPDLCAVLKRDFPDKTVILSSAFYILEECAFIYRNAVQRMNQAIENAQTGVIITETQTVRMPSLYEYPKLLEKALSRSVRTDDAEKAKQIVIKIAELNRKEKNLSLWVERALMQQMFSTVIEAAQTCSDKNEQAAEHVLCSIEMAENSTAMLEALCTFIDSLCGEANEQTVSEKKPQLLNNILECIRAHYTETDFNVSALTDSLSMNNSYVSNYFKEQTGVGLLNYITNLRIQKAKQLLLENPDMPLNDLITQAGFGSVTSFIRIFKKQEGMTPTEFKQEH